jgi:hypothetical protein
MSDIYLEVRATPTEASAAITAWCREHRQRADTAVPA